MTINVEHLEYMLYTERLKALKAKSPVDEEAVWEVQAILDLLEGSF